MATSQPLGPLTTKAEVFRPMARKGQNMADEKGSNAGGGKGGGSGSGSSGGSQTGGGGRDPHFTIESNRPGSTKDSGGKLRD